METSNTYLIVGLGNPGDKYSNTYHNLGFLVIDHLAQRFQNPTFKKKFKGELAEVTVGQSKVVFLKPQTYMNLSGESVGEVVHFYKIDITEKLLVISDDLDLPPGQLRFRLTGGPGGHNGLSSIIEHLNTESFPRLRIGIGRSEKMATESYVLSPIPKALKSVYDEAIHFAADGVETILKEGMKKALNSINQKREV